MKTGGLGPQPLAQPLNRQEISEAAERGPARPPAAPVKAPAPAVGSDFRDARDVRGPTIAPPGLPTASPRRPLSESARVADQFGNKNGKLDEPDLAPMRDFLARYDAHQPTDPPQNEMDHFTARMYRQALPALEEELKEAQAQPAAAKPLTVPTDKPEETIPVASLTGEQAEAAERADRLFSGGPPKDGDLTLDEARAYQANLQRLAVDMPQHAAKAKAQLEALKPLIERLERGEENAALQYVDQRARAGGTKEKGWVDGAPLATGGRPDGQVDFGEVSRLREEMLRRAKADPANAAQWNKLVAVADRVLRRMEQD